MRKIALAGMLTLLMAFAAGCGSSSKSSSSSANGQSPAASQSAPTGTTAPTHFAKTKFALHAGLAFGAFHRYIYRPYREGKFSGGVLHHKATAVKAALAAAFTYHEVRLALDDARSSKILSTLFSPLLALQTKLGSLRDGFKRGNVDPATIQSANGDTAKISAESSSKGQSIQDQPTPQLGG